MGSSYLEHKGVKGMRWRKGRKAKSVPQVQLINPTMPKQTAKNGEPYDAYQGNSVNIVDICRSMGISGSFENRKRIAMANGMQGFTGTMEENMKLVNLAKAGKLKSPKSSDSDRKKAKESLKKKVKGSKEDGELKHFGVSIKDGAPGRGSGRYPLGSGEDGQRAIAHDKNAGETIPKGTTLYRISGTKDDSNSERMYVTYKEHDRDYYKAAWGDVARSSTRKNKVYEQAFTLTEDLKVPSYNARAKMLKELYRENKDAVNDGLMIRHFYLNTHSQYGFSLDEIKTAYYSKEALPGFGKIDTAAAFTDYRDWYVKGSGLVKAAAKGDMSLVASAMQYNDSLMSKYKDKSLKNGYNCIFDDYGTYTTGKNGGLVRMNDSPIVLLNPKQQAKHVKTSEVSNKDADAAQQRYLKWQDGTRVEVDNVPIALH